MLMCGETHYEFMMAFGLQITVAVGKWPQRRYPVQLVDVNGADAAKHDEQLAYWSDPCAASAAADETTVRGPSVAGMCAHLPWCAG